MPGAVRADCNGQPRCGRSAYRDGRFSPPDTSCRWRRAAFRQFTCRGRAYNSSVSMTFLQPTPNCARRHASRGSNGPDPARPNAVPVQADSRPGPCGSAAFGLSRAGVWRLITWENPKTAATKNAFRGCGRRSTGRRRTQGLHQWCSRALPGTLWKTKVRLNSLSMTATPR